MCLNITCETRKSNVYSALSQIQFSREAKPAFPVNVLNAQGQIFNSYKGMFLCLSFSYISLKSSENLPTHNYVAGIFLSQDV